jgi:hypothetical protein
MTANMPDLQRFLKSKVFARSFAAMSKKGELNVDEVDHRCWMPCPLAFPEGTNAEDWAHQLAEILWKSDPKRRASAEIEFLYLYDQLYTTTPCHYIYFHMRAPEYRPLPVLLGIWQMQGGRDHQLHVLAGRVTKELIEPPIVEEFWTEHLGSGLKIMRYERDPESDGGIAGSLGYAWRSEEYETDLQITTASPDLARLQQATPDIDILARALKIVPK